MVVSAFPASLSLALLLLAIFPMLKCFSLEGKPAQILPAKASHSRTPPSSRHTTLPPHFNPSQASLLLLASLALGSALAPAEEPRALQMLIAPNQGMAPTSLPLGTPRSFMLSQGALSFYTFTVPTPFLGFHVSLTNA